jgi:hypothetical protein
MAWSTLAMMRRLLVSESVLIVGLIIVAPALAQSDGKDDHLDRQRRLLEVQAQKVEADVRSALREATNLGSTDAAQAVEKLHALQSKLEDDTILTAKRKETLIRIVKDRIRVTELAARGSEKTDQPETRRQQENRKATEKDEIQQSLDTIRALRKDGKMDEANRSAKELLQKYPDSPAAQTAARTAAAAETLSSLRGLRSDRDQRLSSVSRDIDRSSTPPSGDVEFPKDFRERTKNRGSGTPLTAKEKTILKALDTPITVSFKDSRFQDVVDYVSTLINQPILLDNTALEEAKITYETPVTLKVKGVTVRTLLRKVLGDFGLAYIIKEQAIQVTSALKARETMITRTYNIGDIVDTGGLDSIRFGIPGIQAAQIVQNVNAIIDLIQTSVDPDSWKKNGGTGTIVFHPGTMSLVIRNSAEVHSMLGSGLLR